MSSSLRSFRIQRPSKQQSNGDSSASSASPPTAPGEPGKSQQVYNVDTDTDEDIQDIVCPPRKKPKVLEDTEDEEPPGDAAAEDSRVPDLSSEAIEHKLDTLQTNFPDRERMELQDLLKDHEWSVQKVIDALNPSTNAKSKFIAPKKKAVKRHEAGEGAYSDSDSEGEYNGNHMVYDSDSSNDNDNWDENVTLSEDKKKVLSFFNHGTEHELSAIQGCSKKKVLHILSLRPFQDWNDLVSKIQMSKTLSTDMLNNVTILLRMRDAVAKLMEKCEKITRKMETMVEELTNGTANAQMELTEQPKSINEDLKLTGYQMIGLNWLVLMHKQALNGILADEMGLGKTIQAIAFLAHLKETGDEGPHLVIVPSSTMDNWQKEICLWCPSLRVLNYYGSQDERRHMRLQIVNREIDFDLILTTYNMVISSSDDRVLFRKLDFHYVIYDEAHMLKNMATTRYENLMRVRASRKLLLTGTPLQNNLIELMSLLVFVMPDMFANKKEQLKKMFALFPKSQDETIRSRYEKDRIAHARRIMRPFFLRRLKSEVLTDLPKKTDEVMKVSMTKFQQDLYFRLVANYKERARKLAMGQIKPSQAESGVGFLMNLRKAANHPLLVRSHYDNDKVRTIARLLKRKDPSHANAIESYIKEDLSVMSDYYIHKTCQAYQSIEHMSLRNEDICNSGKFKILDKMLPEMKESGDRVLMFTQFTMILDIMEQYLTIRGLKYLRLDGSTPVQERQSLIDQFNTDSSIFIFILSTKAGGLGINLTAANTVILHDLDFNPYNDKQAEDRCHRVGQTKPVKVIRLMSADTIEEGIHTIAQDKLKLERDLASAANEDSTENGAKTTQGPQNGRRRTNKKDLKKLLKIALGVDLPDEDLGEIGCEEDGTEL